MRWALGISLLSLLAAGPPDPHPLTESQWARLETADDGSGTVDEAAFYALLENATDGPDKEGGAVAPDYDAIRREPGAWRGVRCLVEGTLYRVLKPDLGRRGWERVEGAVIRVDHSREKPIAQDFVIVYLTDPPEWNWRLEREGVPWPSRVRLVARFFKTSSFTTQGGKETPREEKEYLTFVARRIGQLTPVESSGRGAPGLGLPILLAMLLVLVGFIIWRLKSLASDGGGRVRLQDYLDKRHADRTIHGDDTEEGGEPEELPENAADALDALSTRRPME